jgi:hypothetical protein
MVERQLGDISAAEQAPAPTVPPPPPGAMPAGTTTPTASTPAEPRVVHTAHAGQE